MVLKCLPKLRKSPSKVIKLTKKGKGEEETKEISSKVFKALISLSNKNKPKQFDVYQN